MVRHRLPAFHLHSQEAYGSRAMPIANSLPPALVNSPRHDPRHRLPATLAAAIPVRCRNPPHHLRHMGGGSMSRDRRLASLADKAVDKAVDKYRKTAESVDKYKKIKRNK